MDPTHITALRTRLGLTQAQFAPLIGLETKGAVSRLERGSRPPTQPVILLLRLLDTFPDAAKKIQKILCTEVDNRKPDAKI